MLARLHRVEASRRLMASTRSSCSIFAGCALAAALALFGSPAAAQMYPGADVTTNPAGSGRVLLTPGGTPRALPPLLQPGQPFPGQPLPPIHLHMPGHNAAVAHRVRRHRPRVAEQPPAPLPATQSAPAETSQPAPAMEVGDALGGQGTLPPVEKPAAKPRKMASAAPAPAVTPGQSVVQGLARQAVILFGQGATALSANDSARLTDLAPGLNAALTGGASRIELVGYGGQPGEKDSDSRRLSLKRAIAVRQALIGAGLPANRIDVRALGGVEDNGATDRVDIFVKG